MTAIWAERLSRFHNVSSVTLHRNDQTLKYRAVVFERVVVGPGLDEHRDCASTYWSAFLWSEGTPPEGLLLVGGQFRERLRPRLLICSVFYLNRPEPMLAVLANEDQPRMNNPDRKSTRLNSSHLVISYAVFCLKKKKKKTE